MRAAVRVRRPVWCQDAGLSKARVPVALSQSTPRQQPCCRAQARRARSKLHWEPRTCTNRQASRSSDSKGLPEPATRARRVAARRCKHGARRGRCVGARAGVRCARADANHHADLYRGHAAAADGATRMPRVPTATPWTPRGAAVAARSAGAEILCGLSCLLAVLQLLQDAALRIEVTNCEMPTHGTLLRKRHNPT